MLFGKCSLKFSNNWEKAANKNLLLRMGLFSQSDLNLWYFHPANLMAIWQHKGGQVLLEMVGTSCGSYVITLGMSHGIVVLFRQTLWLKSPSNHRVCPKSRVSPSDISSMMTSLPCPTGWHKVEPTWGMATLWFHDIITLANQLGDQLISKQRISPKKPTNYIKTAGGTQSLNLNPMRPQAVVHKQPQYIFIKMLIQFYYCSINTDLFCRQSTLKHTVINKKVGLSTKHFPELELDGTNINFRVEGHSLSILSVFSNCNSSKSQSENPSQYLPFWALFQMGGGGRLPSNLRQQ